MKKAIKIILISLILGFVLAPVYSFAATNVDGLGGYISNKNPISGGSSSLSKTIETVGLRFLSMAKNIFTGVLLIILVYAGARMIVSMGTDEDALSNSKRTLWYSAIGLFFINMPGAIYNAIRGTDQTGQNVSGGIGSSWSNEISSTSNNLFINIDIFADTINDTIIRFLKIGLVGLSIMVIILAGYKIMMARGKEDEVSDAKNRIMWAVIGLVFVGFIEAWQRFVYNGKISGGKDIFESVANLALFLAAPVMIFFLSLAGYYYITAAGDEEKTKKAKTIIVNVLIATAILLISFIFLYDLRNV